MDIMKNQAKNLKNQAKNQILKVKVVQNNSVIPVTRFFRYLLNKKLRRSPFLRYSSEFRYLGFRYSSRYLYIDSFGAECV